MHSSRTHHAIFSIFRSKFVEFYKVFMKQLLPNTSAKNITDLFHDYVDLTYDNGAKLNVCSSDRLLIMVLLTFTFNNLTNLPFVLPICLVSRTCVCNDHS